MLEILVETEEVITDGGVLSAHDRRHVVGVEEGWCDDGALDSVARVFHTQFLLDLA